MASIEDAIVASAASAEQSGAKEATLSPQEQAWIAAASCGDTETLRSLLTSEAIQPWYESPDLGWSALHFAAENGHTKCVRYLLANGALWNAVDLQGVTAAEVAWSGNWDKTYAALLEEGVRQTMLLSVLQKKQNEATMAEDEEGGIESEDAAAADEAEAGPSKMPSQRTSSDQDGGSQQGRATLEGDDDNGSENQRVTLTAPDTGEVANDNLAFLKSPLRFTKDSKGKERCVDQDDNLVMAGWETEIMRRTASALCRDLKPREWVRDEDGEERWQGFSVLNIGYGLGIVDDFFQKYKPARHVIVEAHPDVLAYLDSREISKAPGVEIVRMRWEDALASGVLGDFDIVYADPFAQDYADLKNFFDQVPDLLSGPSARFSFFHGLAGTNRFFYDVYTRLAELDLRDVGLETQWESVKVGMEDRQETWKGIKREYWSLDEFRLPVCQMTVI